MRAADIARAHCTRASRPGLPKRSRLKAGWTRPPARQGFVWVAGGFSLRGGAGACRRVLIAALLLPYAAAAGAVCDSTAACLRTIEESQRATRSLSAHVEQTKHLSLMSEPLVSRGRFAFQAPDQVLWQLDDPKVTVRIDQHGVHLPDLPNAEGEVAAMAQFGEMMRELSGMFTGSLSGVEKTFEVTATGDALAIHVHLTPRNEEWRRMFRSLELTFAMPDLVLHTIHIDEALGDSLDIVFSEVHRNDAAADAVFAASGPSDLAAPGDQRERSKEKPPAAGPHD